MHSPRDCPPNNQTKESFELRAIELKFSMILQSVTVSILLFNVYVFDSVMHSRVGFGWFTVRCGSTKFEVTMIQVLSFQCVSFIVRNLEQMLLYT
jgi:hypothetical protein